jgi:hypothetical protein
MANQDGGNDGRAAPAAPDGGADASARPQARTPKEQLVSYLIPVTPLVILFVLFIGIIFFTENVLRFQIPEAARSFIFIIFTFFACAVYLTKVLGENTSIKINGWALNGTLAIIFVVGYFAAERFQDIAAAIGLDSTSRFTLAEVVLSCRGGNPGAIAQSRRIYTLIGGDTDYINYVRQTLEPIEEGEVAAGDDGLVPVQFVNRDSAEFDFLSREDLTNFHASWLAYSVAARSNRIPIPTKLNLQHSTAFYIDTTTEVGLRDSVESIAEMPSDPVATRLIPVAWVTIEPRARPHRDTGATDHQVKIVLNVLGRDTPCWSAVNPDGP